MPALRRLALAACLATLALASGPPPAHAQAQLTMAVTYFDNHTGQAALDPLSKGLADMLITDLSVAKELRLVEREKLQAVLDELKLSGSGVIDPKTAQRMGKLIGADLVLTGSMVAVEPTMRLDARLISVESGEIVATAKAEGATAEFFTVEAALVAGLLDALGVALTPIQKLQVGKAPTKSYQAMRRYSEALDSADRGDPQGEKKALQEAVAADPTFKRAHERLAALEARLAALERRTDAVERAGGLILKPTTAADFWSNYTVHLERKEMAEAIAALQGALKVKPDAYDVIERWATHVAETSGKAPDAAAVRRAVPTVDAGVAGVVTAIAARDAGAAIAAADKLREDDVYTRWLRVRALGPDVNPKPTALERADELGLLYRLRDAAARAALGKRFVAASNAAAAFAWMDGRLDYYEKPYEGFRLRPREIVQPPVAYHFDVPGKIGLRIAEPSPQNVEIALPGGAALPATYERVAGMMDAAMYRADLPTGKAHPAGFQRVTVKYRDGKGRAVAYPMGVWFPPATRMSDNRWRNIAIGIHDANDELPGQLLVDPVARTWTAPQETDFFSVEFGPRGETPPFATGLPLFYRSAELDQTGFTRPVILRWAGRGEGYGMLGRARYFWEKRSDEREGAMVAHSESLANDLHPTAAAWGKSPEQQTMDLIVLGDYAGAVDASLALRLQGTVERGWSSLPHTSSDGYLYVFHLAAAKRASHRYAEYRAGAAWLPSWNEDAAWVADLVAHVDGALAFDALWQRATALDEAARGKDYEWRFRAEAAAVAALADPRWHADAAKRARVEEAVAYAPYHSTEQPILTALVRERALRDDAEQIEVGGDWVDRWEVTVDDYAACVSTGRCRRVSPSTCAVARGGNDAWSWQSHMSTACYQLEPNAYPVTWLTKGQAADYCKWRGGRLPSASEWKRAARGAPATRGQHDNLLDAVSCHLSFVATPDAPCDSPKMAEAFLSDGYLGIAARGTHPAGRAPSGAEQLRGNVAEWVSDGANQAAGCSYFDPPGAVPGGADCATLVRDVPRLANGHVGFRCAYDDKPRKTPAAQAKGEGAPRSGKGKPSVRWAKIPGGTLARGAAEPPLTIAMDARDDAALRAFAARVDGADEGEIRAFFAALRKEGVSGEVSSHVVQEIALRGWHQGWAPKASFAKVVGWLTPREGEEAQRAVAAEAREQLGLDAYHDGAFMEHATRLGEEDGERRDWRKLTPPERKQALFVRLMTYDGNDFGARRELAPRDTLRGLLAWDDHRAPGCLPQAPGRCIDQTGVGATGLDSGGFVREEAVEVAPFELMTTEVTQAMYRAATGEDPSFEACEGCAVTQVTWDQAAAFCQAIGARLPTEDEWEWAARGGAPVGRPGRLDEIAWYGLNAGHRPREVGGKRANAYGVHDLLGGVWEWASDDHEPGRDYEKSVRGGSWGSDPRFVRPERRVGVQRRIASDFIGFRCAR